METLVVSARLMYLCTYHYVHCHRGIPWGGHFPGTHVVRVHYDRSVTQLGRSAMTRSLTFDWNSHTSNEQKQSKSFFAFAAVFCLLPKSEFLFLQHVSFVSYSYRQSATSVRMSVRPSRAGIVSKRSKLESWNLHRQLRDPSFWCISVSQKFDHVHQVTIHFPSWSRLVPKRERRKIRQILLLISGH